jgi:rRNA maturation RNase YbeY
MSQIFFFSEQIPFTPSRKSILREWLSRCTLSEKKSVGVLNYIFCSDSYLRAINKKYLNHDYYTDIITFPSSAETGQEIGGDIYISIDRVRDNAKTYGVKVADELHRVMVHGLLHLCGYRDKSPRQKSVMTAREDFHLSRRHEKLK